MLCIKKLETVRSTLSNIRELLESVDTTVTQLIKESVEVTEELLLLQSMLRNTQEMYFTCNQTYIASEQVQHRNDAKIAFNRQEIPV